jgi:hypothetical protein
MVSELGKVQEKLGGAYLSAFPSEHFDRVENLKGVWAPYYVVSSAYLYSPFQSSHQVCGGCSPPACQSPTLLPWSVCLQIHKIMLGLVDAHVIAGIQQALEIVSKMADYHYERTAKAGAVRGASKLI